MLKIVVRLLADALLVAILLFVSAGTNTKDIVPSEGAPAANPFTFDATFVFRFTVAILWIAAGVLLVRMRSVR